LRPQQQVARTVINNRKLVAVGEGVLAVESVLGNHKRQILDFLMPGDLISSAAYLSSAEVSIRAVTAASIIRPIIEGNPQAWELLFEQMQAQLARTNIHQLMIGHQDVISRVATFLFSLTLRSKGVSRSGMRLALPMSRVDIADHLAMNPDTLSRIMMRFETLNVIKRINRHAIHITDIEKLGLLTPLWGMLLAVLGRPARSEIRTICVPGGARTDVNAGRARSPQAAPAPAH